QTATAGMTGAADPQSVVEAMLEAEMAIETAVTVRDKVVEAYQEILRMPVCSWLLVKFSTCSGRR
ncbi:MAG: flagellar hook-basal body complex protein FliE, partial [Neomegalonema sp.]